jgi:sugar phosphate isomerase/epimerase
VIKTELSCIEWGSDIHLPYDEPDKAADIAAEMKLYNLTAASYGSYYRLGWLHEPNLLEMILNVTKIIGAPMLRVWGGGIASKYINAKMRREIIDDALKVAAAAKQANMSVSLEYHPDSITDTPESAVKFMDEIRNWGGSNVYLYWQPRAFLDFAENKRQLIKILPFLSNIHVQSQEGNTRFLLWEHMPHWKEYINIIKDSGMEHTFLLEFTKDDNPDFFVDDAKVLIDLLSEA